MVDYFELNRSTGQLLLIKPVDRENSGGAAINFINLIVQASPFNYLGDNNIQRNKRSIESGHGMRQKRSTPPNVRPAGFNPDDKTMLWVQVVIQDVNDHAPAFQQKNLSIGITRKTQFGEIILNLKVSVMSYRNCQNVTYFDRI